MDALVRAWRSLDQLQDSESFRAWLTQIARRVCWNLRSRQQLVPMLQLSSLPDGGASFASGQPPVDAMLDAGRMKEALHQALDALPEDQRNVYRLRDLEGTSGEETARRLGLTLPSMKSRLLRARTQIRRKLEAEFGRQSDDQ